MTDQLNLQVLGYGFPNPQHPYYHLRLRLEPSTSGYLAVSQVRADGRRTRDFWVYTNGDFDGKNIFRPGQQSELYVRLDWANGSSHQVEVDLETANQKR